MGQGGDTSADRTEKLAITPEACREFFSFPIPDSKMKFPLTEFGRDIAMMVLCLAGINTVDLYNLRKQDFKDGIIRYQRAKTKMFCADGAYMEMRVPAIIQPPISTRRASTRWRPQRPSHGRPRWRGRRKSPASA